MSQSHAVNPAGFPPFRLRATVSAFKNTSGMTTALPRLSTTPPSWSAGKTPARRRKSRWLVAPSAAPSAVGGWWMMSAPIAACTVTGTPCAGQARQQLDKERAEAALDDVPAQHRADGAPAHRRCDLLSDVARILDRQHVGQGVPESGEALVTAGSAGEEGGVDFVGARGDGDGLEAGKVRLGVVGHGRSGRVYSLSFRVTWPNENLDCIPSMMRGSSTESQMRVSCFSPRMPPALGIFGRITIASHLRPATPTRSRPSTSTMTGFFSGRK